MTAAEGLPLLTREAPGRATITLNRPRHLNRLHREDLLALQTHIQKLAADRDLRVVVLTGRGRAFCAGFNLQELEQQGAAGIDPQLFEHTVEALALPVRGMKMSLNEIARGQWRSEQLRLHERACADSAGLQEGLAAFAAPRSARFEGR